MNGPLKVWFFLQRLKEENYDDKKQNKLTMGPNWQNSKVDQTVSVGRSLGEYGKGKPYWCFCHSFFLLLFNFNKLTYITFLLAYLRDVVEYGECEACEDEPEKEKEPDDGLVHVPVLHVAQGVPRDVVAQPDGCDRDENKVGRVKKGPGRVNH